VFPGARTAAQLAAHQWEPLDDRTGHALKAVATAETDPPNPASIYAATKYAQEDIVRIGCEAFGIGYAILRLQNVYGEGQSLNNPYTGILSIFSTRIRRGLDLPLFEDAAESRDFVHVDDVAESLLRAITRERAPNTVINVGSGRPTSVRDVAEGLARAFGQEPRVRVTGEYRLGDIRHNWADVSRLKQLLDYEPKVTLEAGLGRFAAWVGEQPLPEDQLDRANAELKQRNLMGQ
jgi:dTDP-L-rhamnose 4-epimerase